MGKIEQSGRDWGRREGGESVDIRGVRPACISFFITIAPNQNIIAFEVTNILTVIS
jgi:hypothetical protein